MTEAQAVKLKAGDRVVWDDGTPGRVVLNDGVTVMLKFKSDGAESYLDVRDCQRVKRAK